MGFGYTYIDGERVEVAVAAAFGALKKAFEAAFPGLTLRVSSGVRTREEQAYLYRGWINRLPGFNLAAPPGSSNHEETGPIGPRAIDIRDTGSDKGVASRGSARDLWMEANAGRFGFVNAGYRFKPVEAWHKEFMGALGVVSGPAAEEPKKQEEEDMKFDNGNRIYWPNGYFNVYRQDVYNALKFWHETGSEQPGTEGTVNREVWAANNYMQALSAKAAADATLALLKSSGLPVSVDLGSIDVSKIVEGVVQSLPKPPSRYEVSVVSSS